MNQRQETVACIDPGDQAPGLGGVASCLHRVCSGKRVPGALTPKHLQGRKALVSTHGPRARSVPGRPAGLAHVGLLSLLSGLHQEGPGSGTRRMVTGSPEAAPQPPCAGFHVGSGSLAASEPLPWAETSVHAGPSPLDGESGTGSAACEGPVLRGSRCRAGCFWNTIQAAVMLRTAA